MAATQFGSTMEQSCKDGGQFGASQFDPGSPGSGVKNEARSVTDELKEKGSQMAETVKGVAGDVTSRVKEMAENVACKAEETKDAAGGQMHAVAGKIREGGEAMSRKADEFGTYLQEHDFGDMGREITEVVRKYPVQALLVGIGLGILLGRSTR